MKVQAAVETGAQLLLPTATSPLSVHFGVRALAGVTVTTEEPSIFPAERSPLPEDRRLQALAAVVPVVEIVWWTSAEEILLSVVAKSLLQEVFTVLG